jgi:hypothetical protein
VICGFVIYDDRPRRDTSTKLAMNRQSGAESPAQVAPRRPDTLRRQLQATEMRVPWESCMRIAVGSLPIALFSIAADRHRVRYEDPQCIAKSMAKSVSGTRSRSARTPIPPLPPSHRSVERLHIDWLRESSLGMSAAVHVVGHKLDKVLVSIRDDGLAGFGGRLFAGPVGLSSGPVAV